MEKLKIQVGFIVILVMLAYTSHQKKTAKEMGVLKTPPCVQCSHSYCKALNLKKNLEKTLNNCGCHF